MPTKSPAVPRPSASLVVVNSKNEILLVQRTPRATSFSGMHVFPGGNYDAKQDDSYELTAVRETFEESGLLLASRRDGGPPISLPEGALGSARSAIHSNNMLFNEFLEEHSLAADVRSLVPFTQWITPSNAARRFHTHFFVAFLPTISSIGLSQGHLQHHLPTPDGGQEVVEARFVHPSVALAEFTAGRISVMPPQFYILTTLASILQGTMASEIQRDRVETLARGAFGNMVLNPRTHVGPDVPKGYTCFTYEGDETRDGQKGRLHRSVVRLAQGMPRDIILHRNFDIFTESPQTQSKL